MRKSVLWTSVVNATSAMSASEGTGKPTIIMTTFNSNVLTQQRADLSKTERKAYSNAVLCLQAKPSKLDPALYPGAKTRFDDFVIVHVNQSRSIHATGNFLTWHRYFTWTYEQALKTECNYKGAQPVSYAHVSFHYNTNGRAVLELGHICSRPCQVTCLCRW